MFFKEILLKRPSGRERRGRRYSPAWASSILNLWEMKIITSHFFTSPGSAARSDRLPAFCQKSLKLHLGCGATKIYTSDWQNWYRPMLINHELILDFLSRSYLFISSLLVQMKWASYDGESESTRFNGAPASKWVRDVKAPANRTPHSK